MPLKPRNTYKLIILEDIQYNKRCKLQEFIGQK